MIKRQMGCSAIVSFVLMNTAVFNLGVQRFLKDGVHLVDPSLMRTPLVRNSTSVRFGSKIRLVGLFPRTKNRINFKVHIF